MLITLETPSELLPFIAFRLVEVLLFRVLFGLLEEILEFLGDHGHFLFIKIQVVVFQGLWSKASVSLGLLFLLRASS